MLLDGVRDLFEMRHSRVISIAAAFAVVDTAGLS